MSTISGTTFVGITLLAANNSVTVVTGAYIDGANSSIALYGASGTTWATTNSGRILGDVRGARPAGVGAIVANTGFVSAIHCYGSDLLAGGVVGTSQGSNAVYLNAGGGLTNLSRGVINGFHGVCVAPAAAPD